MTEQCPKNTGPETIAPELKTGPKITTWPEIERTIRTKAYFIYEERQRTGTLGDDLSDYAKAREALEKEGIIPHIEIKEAEVGKSKDNMSEARLEEAEDFKPAEFGYIPEGNAKKGEVNLFTAKPIGDPRPAKFDYRPKNPIFFEIRQLRKPPVETQRIWKEKRREERLKIWQEKQRIMRESVIPSLKELEDKVKLTIETILKRKYTEEDVAKLRGQHETDLDTLQQWLDTETARLLDISRDEAKKAEDKANKNLELLGISRDETKRARDEAKENARLLAISKGETKAAKEKAEKIRKHRNRIIVGALIVFALIGAAVTYHEWDENRKPEPPARPPAPTALATPKPSQAAASPTPAERAPEIINPVVLGVKKDSTGHYIVVDKNTGKDLGIQNHPLISYAETGVGKTKNIPVEIKKGQTAIIQGYTVDGTSMGVYKAVIAEENGISFSVDITDGSVAVVDSKYGPTRFVSVVNTAIDNKWAIDNIAVPPQWQINGTNR